MAQRNFVPYVDFFLLLAQKLKTPIVGMIINEFEDCSLFGVFNCILDGNPHVLDRKIINANNQLPPDDFTLNKKLLRFAGRWMK